MLSILAFFALMLVFAIRWNLVNKIMVEDGQIIKNYLELRYEDMVDNHHLNDCFECGSCAFVCPSHIPLVQHFRVAKSMAKKLKATQAEKEKSHKNQNKSAA